MGHFFETQPTPNYEGYHDENKVTGIWGNTGRMGMPFTNADFRRQAAIDEAIYNKALEQERLYSIGIDPNRDLNNYARGNTIWSESGYELDSEEYKNIAGGDAGARRQGSFVSYPAHPRWNFDHNYYEQRGWDDPSNPSGLSYRPEYVNPRYSEAARKKDMYDNPSNRGSFYFEDYRY